MGKHDDTVDRTNAGRTPRRIESSDGFATTYESRTAGVTLVQRIDLYASGSQERIRLPARGRGTGGEKN